MDQLFTSIPGSRLSPFDILLLILYALTCLGIGLYASRRKTDSDFMIAGRKIGIIGFVTSVVASYIGGAALVAYTAYVYRFGISAIAVFVGTAIGFIAFIPYAMKLRKFSGEKQFFTLSDWFNFKLGKTVGLASAVILLFVYSGMLLNQFIAGSSILAKISGWSYETGLLISSALIATYLLAGGFRSVIRTDIFQYMVILVMVVVLAVVMMGDRRAFAVELVDFSRMNIGMTIAFTMFGILIIFQSAEYWQRVYGAKSNRVVKAGFIGSAIFTVLTGIAITMVGLAAHVHVQGIEAKDAFAEGLTLLMPHRMLGGALILIFAAIMSSADTQIFVLASSVAVDWFDKLSGKPSDDKRRMKITRIGIVTFTSLSFLGAFFLRDLVAVIVFITGIGFTIIPAAIASFHWQIKPRAALASFITGTTYILILFAIALFQQHPFEFFKDNADLAILSIVVSALTLAVASIHPKRSSAHPKRSSTHPKPLPGGREGLNMKKTFILVVCFCFGITITGFGQADSLRQPVKEKKKKGWTWAALPVLAYDADQGFQFGALGQVFNYGDGSTYPDYKHTIYAETSWFTKGSAVYQLFYDSKYLIPGIRVTADVDYLTERALDFYGFNGAEANYISSVTRQGSDDYISRVFYKQERKMFRVMADFQGPILGQKLRWLAGINVIDIRTATVDINRINKGKKEADKLPDTALLYDQYVAYQLIRPDEKDGGTTVYLKLGVVFDTRDHESAPDKGFWSEIMLLTAPAILGNQPYAFTRLVVTQRQYVPVVSRKLVAAYQLSYQGTLGGKTPYYILPYIYSSYSLTTKPDGLGGARTIRGMMRNRVVGDGVAFGNVELRWKFLRSVVFKQNLYLGLTGFLDGGMVVQEHKIDRNNVPENLRSFFFSQGPEQLHLCTGLGMRIAINENFIIAVDYGVALNKQDGTSGLYIGIGNIF